MYLSSELSKYKRGFTLIELLVVVAIIGILSSIVVLSLHSMQSKARDARRLSDMRQIRLALELYYNSNNTYPNNTDNDCSGWDAGFNGGPLSNDPFIQPLKDSDLTIPGDPTATGNCGGYSYYLYTAGSYGCDASRGDYYVLGVRDMENSGNPHPSSPGWSCTNRNWQNEFDWVTGEFVR